MCPVSFVYQISRDDMFWVSFLDEKNIRFDTQTKIHLFQTIVYIQDIFYEPRVCEQKNKHGQ